MEHATKTVPGLRSRLRILGRAFVTALLVVFCSNTRASRIVWIALALLFLLSVLVFQGPEACLELIVDD